MRAGQISQSARVATVASTCILLMSCSVSDKFAGLVDPKYGVASSPREFDFADSIPKGGGAYRVGKPYTIGGRQYVPEENKHYRAEGLASWYGDAFHGRRTANGEVFDMTSLTAAHPTLPMPSYVRVTNLGNGKSLIVRVNDRGPYHGNRVIDVSNNAARLLDFQKSGVARVRVEYVGRAPLEGSDDRLLEATLRAGEPAPPPSTIRIASAKSFVPDVAVPGRQALRQAPMPEGRPYTLGDTSSDSAAAGTTSSAETSAPRAANANDQTTGRSPGGSPPITRPIAAYAPVSAGHDGVAALLSGRGLY